MQQHILVIGVGSIGERHVRCFQQTGRAAVSLCEVNPALRDAVAEKYGIAEAFDSVETAIAARPDAAVICTPAQLHVPLAQQLVAAGIPVLIEKPLSTSRQGVAELLATIEQNAIRAAVAYVYRAHPVLESLREALQSGRFGNPVQAVVVSGQHFPHYRPAYREIYYTRHETGGGAIQDALTHMVNAVEWLVGPVDELVADAAHLLLKGVEVEDTVHLLTRHGRVLGNFSLNQHQAPNETTLTIHCERGSLRFEAHRSRWLSCSEPGTEWLVEFDRKLERDDLFVRQAGQFLDYLADLREPACSLREALATLNVNLTALASARERVWKQVPHD